ncbi:MAG: MBL fold metallo-hydrolase, partial [Myxococcota bacterium]
MGRRRYLWLGAACALVLVAGGAAASCSWAAPGYRGPKSAHFDGERFQNLVPKPDKSFWSVLKWQVTRDPPTWERLENASYPAPPERVHGDGLRITFINHASVLIQTSGLNILTDPIYSERASPLGWAGPARVREPGISFSALPTVDAVLISHNHYDHLDLDTLRRLSERDGPLIVAGLGTRAHLEDHGIPGGHDLDWWETLPLVDGVSVSAVPAQHWSARFIGDRRNTLWVGFVIEGAGGPIYFAGDTGWGPHFELIAERFSPFRAALIPIGAYQPRWFMKDNHIAPFEAADAAFLMKAQASVPIHFGTFPLGD